MSSHRLQRPPRPGTSGAGPSRIATCDPDGPDDEIGKNRSGSANWQAAKERQCSSGTSGPITRWLVRDMASASAPR